MQRSFIVKLLYPPPLQSGDKIMVIAPSSPGTYVREHVMQTAKQRFDDLGLHAVLRQTFILIYLLAHPKVLNNALTIYIPHLPTKV